MCQRATVGCPLQPDLGWQTELISVFFLSYLSRKHWFLFWRLSRLGRVSGGDKKFWWSVRKDITGDLLTSSLAYSGNWRFCHSDWREMVILTSVLYIFWYYSRNNLLHLQIYNAVPCLYAICVSRVTNIWDFSLNLFSFLCMGLCLSLSTEWFNLR